MAKLSNASLDGAIHVDLDDGESVKMRGETGTYILSRVGDVYSCSCPAWRNQYTSGPRTCKHLKKLRGDDAENERLRPKLRARDLSGRVGTMFRFVGRKSLGLFKVTELHYGNLAINLRTGVSWNFASDTDEVELVEHGSVFREGAFS